MASQAISELIEVGAPNKRVLDTLLVGYHGLVIPFAIGLHAALDRGSKTGPLLLACAGTLGVILTLFFPCDPGCEPFVSTRGTMHIVIAIPMGFAILFAIFAFSRRLSRFSEWRSLSRYSQVTFVIGVSLAVVTVLLAESSYVGILERILTVTYLQWYAAMGFFLIRRGLSESKRDLRRNTYL